MLSIMLIAKNSDEDLNMVLTPQDDGELSVTILGQHEGKDIQMDFNELETEDVDDLIWLLQRRRGQMVRTKGDNPND